MLASKGTLDTLSSLLRLVKDPETVEAHVKKLQDAESSYKETVTKHRKEIDDARNKLNNDRISLESREKVLAENVAKVSDASADLNARETALAKRTTEFESFEAKTSASLAAQEQQLKAAEKALADRKATTEADITKRVSAVAAQERDLERRLRDLVARETDAKALADKLDAKAKKLAEAFAV
jgi:chromosome segregation ATPase